jgi:7-cyano-7-deazaguanine reductase
VAETLFPVLRVVASRPFVSPALQRRFAMPRKPTRPSAQPAAALRVAAATPPTLPSKALQVFANPAPGRDYLIRFQLPEFTCLCPLTGQPDFAHFSIDMVADKLCVELKSLKLYFWSYRSEGAFHEKVTNTVLDDIVEATQPRFIRITARWYVRGGIYTEVVAEHRKKGWKATTPITLPAALPATGMAA